MNYKVEYRLAPRDFLETVETETYDEMVSAAKEIWNHGAFMIQIYHRNLRGCCWDFMDRQKRNEREAKAIQESFK